MRYNQNFMESLYPIYSMNQEIFRFLRFAQEIAKQETSEDSHSDDLTLADTEDGVVGALTPSLANFNSSADSQQSAVTNEWAMAQVI